MTTTTEAVTRAAIKAAIEGRDGRRLAGFYADDAQVRVIDRNNPLSRPREIRGRAAITTFWDDICSRAMTHSVDVTIADGDRLAFTQACAYPDGTRVFCIATLELKDRPDRPADRRSGLGRVREGDMLVARSRIDARFGHKASVIDLMRKWEREIGPQVGLADMQFELLTGSIGAREATVEASHRVESLAQLEAFFTRLGEVPAHAEWGKAMEPLVVSGTTRWEILRVL
jgi:ketosteroid isomerase-like protein